MFHLASVTVTTLRKRRSSPRSLALSWWHEPLVERCPSSECRTTPWMAGDTSFPCRPQAAGPG